jgi:hypothetical protein
MLYNILGHPKNYGLNSLKNMVTLAHFFKKTICNICSLFFSYQAAKFSPFKNNLLACKQQGL